MERSITQLKVNTIKNENRTKLHIKKKTDENQKLLGEINKMKESMYELNISNKKLTNQVREFEEKMRKDVKQGEYGIGKQPSVQSMTMKGVMEESIPSLVAGRPHSVKKQNQGKLYKGTPYQYRKSNLEDKAKIAELSAQLEDTQQMVMIQKLEIRSLKEKFISLVNDRNRLLAQLEGSGSHQDIDQNRQPMTPDHEAIDGDGDGFLPRVSSKGGK